MFRKRAAIFIKGLLIAPLGACMFTLLIIPPVFLALGIYEKNPGFIMLCVPFGLGALFAAWDTLFNQSHIPVNERGREKDKGFCCHLGLHKWKKTRSLPAYRYEKHCKQCGAKGYGYSPPWDARGG